MSAPSTAAAAPSVGAHCACCHLSGGTAALAAPRSEPAASLSTKLLSASADERQTIGTALSDAASSAAAAESGGTSSVAGSGAAGGGRDGGGAPNLEPATGEAPVTALDAVSATSASCPR